MIGNRYATIIDNVIDVIIVKCEGIRVWFNNVYVYVFAYVYVYM